MRNLTALLFLLSLCSLHLVFSAPYVMDFRITCCAKTTHKKIPLKYIVTYWWTNSNCPIKAIVFETLNNGKHYRCVDPTASWVNHHMKAVDRKNKKL
ncbi:hypothetical protein AMELA_G00011050 [Ameiurus melas]|uniref:Chemokine interleukin-8-like domain-containing protein n=1 Tax=Ameiurus melas TaxID=219545 RepID=A0A7J6BKR7_AMEME|nr:hypothetical protein AMELA_G00011050 [Ameiurus melas]